jgi:hypothetical protein
VTFTTFICHKARVIQELLMFEDVIMNRKEFIPLWSLQDSMSDAEIIGTYEVLRGAFENSHPHNMVDASDAYVLTVFPFSKIAEAPDDYDTVNYEAGFYCGQPALRCCNDSSKILIP